MPWISGAIIGGASLLGGYLSRKKSSSTGQGSTGYVPQGQGTADQFSQDMMRQYGTAFGQASPEIQGGLHDAYAATQPGGQWGNLGNIAQQYMGTLGQQGMGAYGQAQNLYGAGNQLWQTAQDPQQALYQKMLQQTQDQSRTATSMRGIGMGGESAGIENQDVNNFNMQWQNAQLGRQLQGLQGMGGAYAGAGQQQQLGNAQLAGSMAMGQGGAQLPFQMAGAYGQGMSQGVYNPMYQGYGMGSNYMGIGQMGGAQNFAQGQQNLGNFGYGVGALGQAYNQGGGNWLSSLWNQPQQDAVGTGYSDLPGAGVDYGQGGG